MPIRIRPLLGRAWRLLWAQRVFLWLGGALGLLNGTFSLGNGPPAAPSPAPPALAGGPLLLAGCLLLGLAIAALLLASRLEAALIGAADAITAGDDLPPGPAWRAGGQAMWPIVGLNLTLTAALAALLGLLVLVLRAAPHSALALASGGLLVALALAGLLLLLPTLELAKRQAVLGPTALGPALPAGAHILRAAPGPIARLGLAELGLGSLWLLLLGATDLLFTRAGAFGAVPPDPPLVGTTACLLLLIAWTSTGALWGLWLTWTSVLWTLAYTALAPQAAHPRTPPAPPPAWPRRVRWGGSVLLLGALLGVEVQAAVTPLPPPAPAPLPRARLAAACCQQRVYKGSGAKSVNPALARV